MADDEFGESDCAKDKANILLACFAFKDLTGAGYLTFGTQNAFNFLWYAFT